MANKFRYHDLEPGRIRLLRLLPTTSPNVSCELVTTRLSSKDCPHFMALSYSWGDQALHRPLFVDGRLMRVTSNVESFLRQAQWARSPRNSDESRGGKPSFLEMTDLFWIDAICINQADTAERASQVRMMKQIYEAAFYIAVWLGEPTQNTAYAFEYVMNRHQKSIKLTQAEERRSVQGLTEILERPYWSRSWVLQEATTPKTADRKMVLIGDLQAPLDWFFELGTSHRFADAETEGARTDEGAIQPSTNGIHPYVYGISKELSRIGGIDLLPMARLLSESISTKTETFDEAHLATYHRNIHLIMNKSGLPLQKIIKESGVDIYGLVDNMFRTDLQPKLSSLCPPGDTERQLQIALSLWKERIGPLRSVTARRRQSRGVDFYSLPRLIRLQQASDPRDKLFAPLQLTKQARRYLPSYEKPAWVVYCEFAAAMIESDELLDILSFGNKPVTSDTVLPSWVPDWTCRYEFSAFTLPKDECAAADADDIERAIQQSKKPIEEDILESLRGRIGHFSQAITPEGFQRLRPVERPRLIVCAIRIGEVGEEKTLSRFSDLSDYFRGRNCLSFTKTTSENSKLTSIFGVDEGEDKVLILAADAATEGDEVFYVFGARYPLVLRRVIAGSLQRFVRDIGDFVSSSKKNDRTHPDGLREYLFCGEAVCRCNSEDEQENMEWEAREQVLSLFSWGQSPSHYRRILRTMDIGMYADIPISDSIEEIAIV